MDQSGGFMPPQGMYNNGPGGQQQQQQMYAGARGYGGMPGQFQPGYNGFNNSGYNQQQGASNMAAYPQQQQHMGWNNSMGQWNGQQQPGNWANNMSPRAESS